MAISNDDLTRIIDAISARSTDLSALETVQSLENIKSLPAFCGSRLVSAPIALLSAPAVSAANLANTAATNATAAANSATQAKTQLQNLYDPLRESLETVADIELAISEARLWFLKTVWDFICQYSVSAQISSEANRVPGLPWYPVGSYAPAGGSYKDCFTGQDISVSEDSFVINNIALNAAKALRTLIGWLQPGTNIGYANLPVPGGTPEAFMKADGQLNRAFWIERWWGASVLDPDSVKVAEDGTRSGMPYGSDPGMVHSCGQLKEMRFVNAIEGGNFQVLNCGELVDIYFNKVTKRRIEIPESPLLSLATVQSWYEAIWRTLEADPALAETNPKWELKLSKAAYDRAMEGLNSYILDQLALSNIHIIC